jgi:hypothetical protein
MVVAGLAQVSCGQGATEPRPPDSSASPSVTVADVAYAPPSNGQLVGSAGFFVVADATGLLGIEASTGTPVWRLSKSTSTPQLLGAVDNLISVMNFGVGGVNRQTHHDIRTGAERYAGSQLDLDVARPAARLGGVLIAGSGAVWSGYSASSGARLWRSSTSSDTCLPLLSCEVQTHATADRVYRFSFLLGETQHQFVSVDSLGAISRATFELAAKIRSTSTTVVKLDPENNAAVIIADSMVTGVDLGTGATRWQTSLAPFRGRNELTLPLAVNLLRGGPGSQVHLIMPLLTVPLTCVAPLRCHAYDLLLDAKTGAIVRRDSIGIVSSSTHYATACGSDGMALVQRGAAGYTYVASRTRASRFYALRDKQGQLRSLGSAWNMATTESWLAVENSEPQAITIVRCEP